MPLPYDVIKGLIHKAVEPFVGEAYTDGVRVACNIAIHQAIARLHADDTDYAIELTAADASRFCEVADYIPPTATAIFGFMGVEQHPVFPDKINVRFVQKTEWKWFEVCFVL